MFGRPPIGELIAGRYELRGELGSTPSRVAYRAFDREVEVEVALWWLRPELFGSDESIGGIAGAIEAMRSLRESHILRPFEAGRVTDPDTVYVTWQLGTTSRLEGLLAEGLPVPLTDIMLYAKGLAGAIEAAHHNELFHGWIAPADVVEVAGLVKLCGFGIYPAMNVEAALSCWDRDRRYLAPEVLEGRPEPASDWYSIAAMLLDLSVGCSVGTMQDAQRKLRQLSPDRHAALAAALSFDPLERPQSADEFLGPIFDAWGVTGEVLRLPSIITEGGEDIGAHSFLDDDEDEMTLVHSGSLESALRNGPQAVVVDTPVPDDAPTESVDYSPHERSDRVVTSDIREGLETIAGYAPVTASPPPRPETSERLQTSDFVEDGFVDSDVGEGDPATMAESPMAIRRPAFPLPKVPTPLPEDDETLVDAPLEVQLEMVSMKEGAANTEAVATHKSIAKPVIRPLSSLAGAEQRRDLGYLAPPKERRSSALWLWFLLALFAGAAAVGALLYLTDERRGAATRADAEAGADSAGEAPAQSSSGGINEPQPGPASGINELPPGLASGINEPPPRLAGEGRLAPALVTDQVASLCPAEMSYVAGPKVCIEAHESPGAGRLPETGLSLEQARARCAARARRLCTAATWEAACRRKESASWPYGSAFLPEICNVSSGKIEPAGTRSQCKTLVGVYDMSGNTAEWVEDGHIRGGSALDHTQGRCSQLRANPRRQAAYSDVGYRCCADPVASPRSSD